MIRLPPDFKEFLKLLNSGGVEYLLVGGYAVGYYGYPRATGDLDIWVALRADNADKIVAALRQFGFDLPELAPELFMAEERIVRMGVPPFRLEILTTISGVRFEECYASRVETIIDSTAVKVIDLASLKANKQASGRPKDLLDLKHLP